MAVPPCASTGTRPSTSCRTARPASVDGHELCHPPLTALRSQMRQHGADQLDRADQVGGAECSICASASPRRHRTGHCPRCLPRRQCRRTWRSSVRRRHACRGVGHVEQLHLESVRVLLDEVGDGLRSTDGADDAVAASRRRLVSSTAETAADRGDEPCAHRDSQLSSLLLDLVTSFVADAKRSTPAKARARSTRSSSAARSRV